MKPHPALKSRSGLFAYATPIRVATCFVSLSCLLARGDQVDMQNGDRYTGRVLSYTNNVIVLTNDSIGTIRVARTNVVRVVVGVVPNNASETTTKAAAPTVLPGLPTKSLASTITNLDKSSTAEQAEKVKQQLLGDADPAAKAKFDSMLGDLMSGKMSMGDLRVQAASAANQLRALKKELGPESDATLDGYLTVLESFIKEVPATSSVTSTNRSFTAVAPSTEN